MSKSRINIILAITFLSALAVQSLAQTVPPADSEAKLLVVLKSDASHKDKVDALRQLSFIATKDSVPTLAGLLADPKLSHMARYAMEPISDSSVDSAFRKALGQLKGPQLVGLIGSIGVRGKCQGLLLPLTKMLHDHDPQVAQAAARALGSIPKAGYAPSAEAMLQALADAPAANKPAIYEGIFRCAEALAARNRREAVEIYDALLALDAPHQIRTGALRGAILTRGKDGYELIEKYLKSKDYTMFSAAVRTAQQIATSEVAEILIASIGKLPTDNKIVILRALDKPVGEATVEKLYALAKDAKTEKTVRIEAMRTVSRIPTSGSPLADLLNDPDPDIAQAAFDTLGSLTSPATDRLTMKLLESPDPKIQLKGLELIRRRRISDVTDALIKATRDNDESVRTESITILGDLAGAEQFPLLVKLLLSTSTAQEIRAAERAISNVCTRQARLATGKVVIQKAVYGAAGQGPSADVTGKLQKIIDAGAASVDVSNANLGDTAPGIVKQLRVEYTVDGVAQSVTVPENKTVTFAFAVVPPAFIDRLCSAQTKASTPQKLALLRILRTTAGPKALQAVNAATRSSNTEIAGEAVSILCAWPGADALPHILDLTDAADPKTRILALRGALRLIPLQSISPAKKLASFGRIAPLVRRNEEKRLLLGALANVPSADALAMVTPYLDDPATAEEAALAAVTIAEKIAKQSPKEVAQAMQKVIKATKSNKTKNRAKTLIK